MAFAGAAPFIPGLPALVIPREAPLALGRVTIAAVNVRSSPGVNNPLIGQRMRDELLPIYEEYRNPDGPAHNPLWYGIDEGWVYSAYIQRITPLPNNKVLKAIPKGGILGEVTVPYTRAYRYDRDDGWQQLYRLYYSSIHWIYGVDEGLDREAWYRLRDHRIDAEYYVFASDLRVIDPEEYSPISPDVPGREKRIEVSLEEQVLRAYEGDQVVMKTSISSGLHDPNYEEGKIPTDTPEGSFRIQLKMPSRHMGDAYLTDEIGSYELPGVPWTCVFHKTGAALHGTYWHDNFGTKMSHGCVNLRNDYARFLFRWSEPAFTGKQYFQTGPGTLVIVK